MPTNSQGEAMTPNETAADARKRAKQEAAEARADALMSRRAVPNGRSPHEGGGTMVTRGA